MRTRAGWSESSDAAAHACPAAPARRRPAASSGLPALEVLAATRTHHAVAVVADRQPDLEGVARRRRRCARPPTRNVTSVARELCRRRRAAASAPTTGNSIRSGWFGDPGRGSRRAGAVSVDALDLHLGRCPGPPSPSTTRPMAAAVKRSPGRTKRGSAGCTITGSRTASWPVREAEALGAARRLGAQLEVRQVVGELDASPWPCRRARPRSPGCSTARS